MPQKQISLAYYPREWQVQAHKRKARFRVLALHRRAGKALDVDTPIPVWPAGFKRMGDLVAGDVVFDENGKPCDVVFAHDVMLDRRCVEVRFSDGTSIVCDEDHLWHTRTKLDRANRVNRVVNSQGKMSSGLLLPLPGTIKRAKEIEQTLKYAGENNHSIELAGPVKWAEVNLKIPPYIFGCWLGDGHSHTSAITTMDEEIVSAFEKYADTIQSQLKPHKHQSSGKAKTYQIARKTKRSKSSMQEDLRFMGVLKNKHIPNEYMHASIQQRMDLFAGLMDTDGSISKCGRKAEITFKSQTLADGVVRLMWSLGLKPTKNKKTINGAAYWRINFTPLFNPFRLNRKFVLWSPPTERQQFSQQRMIVDVVEVPTRPVRCITVNSASKLYLCGEQCVPTHNTELALMELIDAALKTTADLAYYVYLAPFLKQAKTIAWARLKQRLAPLLNVNAVTVNESELSIKLAHNGAVIRIFGGDNPDALRGVRLDGVVIDEVAQIKPEVWQDIIQPALSDRKGWALFIGTPSGVNLFSELYFRAGSLPDWHAALYTVYDTDALAQDEIARLRRDMSETSFSREYLCDFSAAGEDQLISLSDVQAATQRHYREPEYAFAPRILGVDPARFGDDRSVIFPRQGMVALPPIVMRGVDNMTLANRVAAKIAEWRPDAVFVDAGNGSGVIDRLRQLGHNVVEVWFGGKPIDEAYRDKRAEMWSAMADWLRLGGAIPDDVALKQDLAAPTYSFSPQGKRVLESKDDLKARGLPSPDLGDALALTFAAPVAPRSERERFFAANERRTERGEYNPLERL